MAFLGYRRLLRDEPGPYRPAGDAPVARYGLLFVPGWASNAQVGRPLFEVISSHLGEAQEWFCDWNTEPRPHDEKVNAVLDMLAAMHSHGHEYIVVIGHSYGGLVASNAMLQWDGPHENALLLTLNTPFGGPRKGLITMGRWLTWWRRGLPDDPELAFMNPTSKDLIDLRAGLADRRFQFRTLLSQQDEFVASDSGLWPGTEVETEALWGHTGVLVRPGEVSSVGLKLSEVILEELRPPGS